jgi:hypothetical protein
MPLTVRRSEPRGSWNSLQGGMRFTTTSGRVDWGLSGYRGFRTFPLFTLAALTVVESFPRFTMVGGDVEAVAGRWGVRGELAAFVADELQATSGLRGVPGRSLHGGIGVDRRTGDYRVAANLLWADRRVDGSDPVGRLFAGDPEVERTDVTLVAAADRSFARETRTVRVLAVYDPGDATVFVRAIGAASVRDNVWLEGSAGVFAGSSLDTLGRLADRDFLYARLKVYF